LKDIFHRFHFPNFNRWLDASVKNEFHHLRVFQIMGKNIHRCIGDGVFDLDDVLLPHSPDCVAVAFHEAGNTFLISQNDGFHELPVLFPEHEAVSFYRFTRRGWTAYPVQRGLNQFACHVGFSNILNLKHIFTSPSGLSHKTLLMQLFYQVFMNFSTKYSLVY